MSCALFSQIIADSAEAVDEYIASYIVKPVNPKVKIWLRISM